MNHITAASISMSPRRWKNIDENVVDNVNSLISVDMDIVDGFDSKRLRTHHYKLKPPSENKGFILSHHDFHPK